MPSLVLTPAYGRDYKSKAAALAAFQGGQDFIFHNFYIVGKGYAGTYCSIRDVAAFLADGFTHVEIRYNKTRMLTLLDIRSL